MTERRRADQHLQATVAELARSNADLEAARARRETIQSMLAHDVKAPLANLNWHLQLLKRRSRQGALDVDVLDEFLEPMSVSIREALGVIDELYNMWSPGTSGAVLQYETVDLVQLAT